VTADGGNEQHKIHNSRNEYRILDNVDTEQIVQTPTQQEVVKCIMKLKYNKVPGEDSIVAEMIKCGGEILNRRIYEYVGYGEMKKSPIDGEWELPVPSSKKAINLHVANYRGITLLDVVYKVFSSIFNQRLKVIAELIVGEYQAGFHEKKSTIDQIFVLKQIMEKHYEFGLELHLLFIDYTPAFDSINRTELFAVMEKMTIPHRLIGLTKMTLNKTTATVTIILTWV
jgi:hypothetical protein